MNNYSRSRETEPSSTSGHPKSGANQKDSAVQHGDKVDYITRNMLIDTSGKINLLQDKREKREEHRNNTGIIY